jgi:hypothetical protein
MRELINKELKLSLHPVPIIFLTLSAMVCIPNYPYYITFFYTGLGIFFLFQGNRENRDIQYMMALPIRKRDMVKARFLLVVGLELLQAVACIPFMVISALFIPMNNEVGIEGNVAFIGLALVMMGLFNLIFLTGYYKNGYNIGKPFVVATTVVFLYMIVMEVLLRIVPYMKEVCDSKAAADQIKQLPLFAVCVVLYLLITLFAYHKAAKCFEKIDL